MQELRNLLSVRAALLIRKLSVVVVSSSSKATAFEGTIDAAWDFGCLGRLRLEVLLCCENESHVYVIRNALSLEFGAKDFRDAGAPWFRSVVCGRRPRGRGFRGGDASAGDAADDAHPQTGRQKKHSPSPPCVRDYAMRRGCADRHLQVRSLRTAQGTRQSRL